MPRLLENPYRMPIRYDTAFQLNGLGITDWVGLAALSDRERNLLFGWGPATERRFQALRQEDGG